MSKQTLLGSAVSPFAHLLGIGRASAAASVAAAKPRADESDDDKKKREEEEAAAARAEEETDEEKKKREEEEEEEKARKAKKAKSKAEQDDDDDADASSKAIRQRERDRCAAIFADPAAARRPDVAAQLAFATPLNREQAITTLRAVAAGEREPAAAAPAARETFASRMERVPNPDLGGADEPAQADADPAKATANFILASTAKARGEKIA